jgi:muramoyltetrapeptide carboxypeptidase
MIFQNKNSEQKEDIMKVVSKNSTVGIISPAWIPIDDRLEAGIQYLENKGFKVKIGSNVGKKHAYFAGSDKERLNDIHQMFKDPEVDFIVCARGGWGGLRLVDKINYDLIRKNPKLFVGYSDITTLQLALWTKSGIPSLSGPMVGVEMGKGILPFTEQHFWDQIHNTTAEYKFDYTKTNTMVLNTGQSQGTLLGGCLSLVCHLLGTPYSPDYSGAILFLEDVGEKPYKIDRYFAHLKQAGVFDQIDGLILGDFVDCDPEEKEVSFQLDEILNDYFSGMPFPVLKNFPYGHGDLKFSMPVGVKTILDTEDGEMRFANPFLQ